MRRYRQAAIDFGPALSSVGRLPDTTLAVPWLDPRITPFPPDALPHRGVERIRTGRVDYEVNRAGARASIQDLLPRSPAVGRLEHASVLVVGPLVPRGRDKDNVRVGRVHDDASDRLRIGEAGVRERASAVG